jgi:thymidylate synthase
VTPLDQVTGASPPFHQVWLEALEATLCDGKDVAPRGMPVRERVGVTIRFDALAPLLIQPQRALNYRFAVAEFLWIAAGLEEVAPLARYNKKMLAYSDDGVKLAGAYGPRLASQIDYVVGTLRRDPHSRQAVATIWTPRPWPSKDVPCTVAAQFLARGGRLHGLWTMRSNDLWLGLPYDAFSFARYTACVAGELGLGVGDVVITAGSSHLYLEHWAAAGAVLAQGYAVASSLSAPPLPGFPPYGVTHLLETGRMPGAAGAWHSFPWAGYRAALEAPTSAAALDALAAGAFRVAA